MKLTKDKLTQIVKEEAEKLQEGVMYGTDRFYVIVSQRKDGKRTVARDVENGVFAHKITRAQRFETEGEAQKALERFMETPRAPDPRSEHEVYIAKVRAELERVS